MLFFTSLSSFSREWLAVPIVALLVVVAYQRWRPSATKKFWLSLPMAGLAEKQWFARLRVELRTVFSNTALTWEGYNKYSKLNKPFALPVLATQPFLILPPSMKGEYLDKRDDELSDRLVHMEELQTDYTLDGNILENDFHFVMVRRHLTRRLPQFTPDISDEIHGSFQDYWPQATEWEGLKLYDMAMRIVARAANRVFVSSELCRNEDFLEHSKQYSQGVFVGSIYIRLFPKWLRPVVAPLITYPNRKHFSTCLKLCRPLIEKRLAQMIPENSSPPDSEYIPPNDFLHWLLEECIAQGDPDCLDPVTITSRLMSLNMVAIHTSSIVFTNTVLDLYSSPNTAAFIASLREEVERVKPRDGEPWTKVKVNQLIRIDSAIKESMRLSDLGDTGVRRMVTAKDGITLGKDLHVPYGVNISLPTRPMHRDGDAYDSPSEYRPFRFSDIIEQDAQNGSADMAQNDEREMQAAADWKAPDEKASGRATRKSPTLVTPTDNFLTFGFGRHACPGRFFAATELKLLIAYLVDNYDIEPMAGRSKPFDIAGTTLPSTDAEIRSRLRQR